MDGKDIRGPEACYPRKKNERKQPWGHPGWLGTARVNRLTEESGETRQVGGTQRPREDITGRWPARESAGHIVARKRGNSRGAKEPYHCELV